MGARRPVTALVPSGVMEIVLIRHGEPEWVLDGLNVDNPPLTVADQDDLHRSRWYGGRGRAPRSSGSIGGCAETVPRY